MEYQAHEDAKPQKIKPLGQTLFFIILIGVTVSFVGLISDFLMAGFWAMVLTIVFRGVHKWVVELLNGREGWASALTTILIFFVVLIPITLMSTMIIDESAGLVSDYQEGNYSIDEFVDNLQKKVPGVKRWLKRAGMSNADLKEKLNDGVVGVTTWAGNQAFTFTQNAINFAIQFSLMLYLLFFFLKDSGDLKRLIMRAFPLNDAMEARLIDRFVSVTRATLKGTVVVAVIQGLIGGILFAALGIQGAVLWGAIMMVLSLLPVGGSALVWGPAAIILFIQGDITKALILVLVGGLIIGLVDNLLRPLLVGRDTKMPDYLVLVATLGGISWFGLSGFIIGPVIAALFITCWKMLQVTVTE